MTKYDEFREMFANASPEEKLMRLRSESKRLLSSAHGYSTLINNLIEERNPSELPDDFGLWCQKVIENVEEFRDLIDALTDWKHRSLLQADQVKHDRDLDEILWKRAQKGLPELQNYASMRDAIEQTAHQLELSPLTQEIKIGDSSRHPSSIINFFGAERQAHIGAQASPRDMHYLGYAINLKWLEDKRNLKWQEHEGLAPSIEEAVTVLHLWLVKNEDLQIIRQKYPWMSNGHIQRNA